MIRCQGLARQLERAAAERRQQTRFDIMQALILAGGSGTRFWPLSRRSSPKQLLSFGSEASLLQATVARIDSMVEPESVWICTTSGLAKRVREQLPRIPSRNILEEPVGRNTALAIGWSVSQLPEEVRDEVLVVLPADHQVADIGSFRQALGTAADVAAERDLILTLGVIPTRAETGYGYLETGATLADSSPIRRVIRFTEKPDVETARKFVASGDYLWNAGIFVFRSGVLLDRLRLHQPELTAGLEEIARQPTRLEEIYSRLPAISIDHGLMEKLDDLATVPLECGWTDLGSWEALWEYLDRDGDGNVTSGDVIAVDSHDNLVMSTDGLVATVGVEGLVIVKTGDSVLVVPRSRSQEVRRIVERLRKGDRNGLL